MIQLEQFYYIPPKHRAQCWSNMLAKLTHYDANSTNISLMHDYNMNCSIKHTPVEQNRSLGVKKTDYG